MLSQNEMIFKFHGIDKYHKNNITGKGIKVLVIDNDFINTNSKIRPVCGAGNHSVINWKGGANLHGLYCCETILEIAPDVDLYFATNTAQSFKFASDMGVDFISMSLSYGAPPEGELYESQKEMVKNSVVPITSAGNRSKQGVTFPAVYPEWIAVGACDLIADKPSRAVYSSIGEKLDIMALTSISLPSYPEGKKFYGTSASTPILTGLLALYSQYSGVKFNIKTALNHLIDNSIDLLEEGHDTQTGNGIYVLPPADIMLSTDINKRLIERYIMNGYRHTLNRVPDKKGLVWWTENLQNKTISPLLFFKFILLQSEEFTSKNLSNEEFLRVSYRVFFDREADHNGLEFWLDKLDTGSTKDWVIQAMSHSQEWKNKCKYYGFSVE